MGLFKREQDTATYEMTEEEFEHRVSALTPEDTAVLSDCYVSPSNIDLLLGVHGYLSEEERATLSAWAEEMRGETMSGQTFKLMVTRKDGEIDGELVLNHVVTVPTRPLVLNQ